MANRLIVKLKRCVDDERKLQFISSKSKGKIDFDEILSEIVAFGFMVIEDYDTYQRLMLGLGGARRIIGDCENLKELIKLGFVVRLDDAEDKYNLFVSKDSNSITFSSPKKLGSCGAVCDVLCQAEEWAEELLDEIDNIKTASNEIENSKLEEKTSRYPFSDFV